MDCVSFRQPLFQKFSVECYSVDVGSMVFEVVFSVVGVFVFLSGTVSVFCVSFSRFEFVLVEHVNIGFHRN